MQPVGDLHENNPQVLRHRHGHLLEVLRLRFCAAREGHLVELAHAIHKLGDAAAELRFDCGFGNAGVFDDIVKHRRHETLRIHMHFA